MSFFENNTRIKERENIKILYKNYIDAMNSYNIVLRYRMFWQKDEDGHDILTIQHLKSRKRESLGRRCRETEKTKLDFDKSKSEIKKLLFNLEEKIKNKRGPNGILPIKILDATLS
ncbi:hypothetical protein HUE87_08100 [Candidatus Sulfurimonas marisnigri]|uniref:Uncharacterized protein n=1 Tax=Candidatus Sulfurimonas marisnigri TaxID=2740405 RepID=A0A7S7LYR3_9BACT|nr:hypothetical protein [Candidatus Sulfurimonas marisnigri]QOY53857.1 hypothetical protein HUE87_08100 [Candidatus Sulfurimonas marisnigri]